MSLKAICLSAQSDREFAASLDKHLYARDLFEIRYYHAGVLREKPLIWGIREAHILILLISANWFVEFGRPIVDEILLRISKTDGIIIPVYIRYYQIPSHFELIKSLDWIPSKKRPIEKADDEKLWTYTAAAIIHMMESISHYKPTGKQDDSGIIQANFMVNRKIVSVDGALSRSELRRILQQYLPTVDSFDAFCLDFFPEVKSAFSSGMNRIERTNLLLESIDCGKLQKTLEEFLHPSNPVG